MTITAVCALVYTPIDQRHHRRWAGRLFELLAARVGDEAEDDRAPKTGDMVLLDLVDGMVFGKGHVIDRRRRKMHAIVAQRQKLADSCRMDGRTQL